MPTVRCSTCKYQRQQQHRSTKSPDLLRSLALAPDSPRSRSDDDSGRSLLAPTLADRTLGRSRRPAAELAPSRPRIAGSPFASADSAGRMWWLTGDMLPGPSVASPSPMVHSGGVDRVSNRVLVTKLLAPPGAVAGTLARRAERGIAGNAGRGGGGSVAGGNC